MGVVKKIKRALSFRKKDKTENSTAKRSAAPTGAAVDGSWQAATRSAGPPTVGTPLQPTTPETPDVKKKSNTLRTLFRKASFGRKDKKPRSSTASSLNTSSEEGTLLASVVSPAVSDSRSRPQQPQRQHLPPPATKPVTGLIVTSAATRRLQTSTFANGDGAAVHDQARKGRAPGILSSDGGGNSVGVRRSPAAYESATADAASAARAAAAAASSATRTTTAANEVAHAAADGVSADHVSAAAGSDLNGSRNNSSSCGPQPTGSISSVAKSNSSSSSSNGGSKSSGNNLSRAPNTIADVLNLLSATDESADQRAASTDTAGAFTAPRKAITAPGASNGVRLTHHPNKTVAAHNGAIAGTRSSQATAAAAVETTANYRRASLRASSTAAATTRAKPASTEPPGENWSNGVGVRGNNYGGGHGASGGLSAAGRKAARPSAAEAACDSRTRPARRTWWSATRVLVALACITTVGALLAAVVIGSPEALEFVRRTTGWQLT